MLQPGGELAAAAAVIVYCTYQAQCGDVAGFLCTRGIVAAAYHAGKPMQVHMDCTWTPKQLCLHLP